MTAALAWQTVRILLASTLMSGAVWALAGHSLAGRPARDPEVEAGLRSQFFDVTFPDAQRGWVVGGAGRILRTTDGGKTWAHRTVRDYSPPRSRPGFIPPNLLRITFVSRQKGWIVGEEGSLVHSRNGGASWESQPQSTQAAFSDIRFIDQRVGWIVGDRGLILKTRDGGRTWQRQQSGARHSLQNIACFSARECVIGGGTPTILVTRDGGATWQRRGVPDGAILPWVGRMVIARDGTLWMGGGYHNDGSLLRSPDRGMHWTLATDALLSAPTALFFWDASRGVVFSDRILLTVDGGATWKEGQTTARGVLLHALVFIDDRLGWAVGDFRTILHTRDGGATWNLQYTESTGRPR